MTAPPDHPPATHNHVWSPWRPHDRYSHYRYCLVFGCRTVERRDASTGEVTAA